MSQKRQRAQSTSEGPALKELRQKIEGMPITYGTSGNWIITDVFKRQVLEIIDAQERAGTESD